MSGRKTELCCAVAAETGGLMTSRSTERTDPSSSGTHPTSESMTTTTTVSAATDMEIQHSLPTISEFPVTPTFQTAELQQRNPVSTPNVDFDTAAYMLMTNDEDFQLPTHSPGIRLSSTTNSPIFQTVKLPVPYLSMLNTPGTPPAFDFDSIGQMLMSPNSGAFANAPISNIPFSSSQTEPQLSQAQYTTQTLPPDMLTGFAGQFDKSPHLNTSILPSIQGESADRSIKDYLPWSAPSPTSYLFPPSINSPLTAGPVPSPVMAISQLPTGSAGIATNQATMTRSNIGLESMEADNVVPGLGFVDITKKPSNIVVASAYNKELLSTTETLALESFLDSIANEGMVSKGKSKTNKSKTENKKKRKFDTAIGSDDNSETHNGTRAPANEEIQAVSMEEKEEKAKLPMTKQERKLVHNLTEQKRRDMIKEAFEYLHELIKNSRFDLEDKTTQQQQAKKRKRKRANADRPMKKFEVLKRSVREIEILLEKNRSLYTLLNERETHL